MNDNDVINESVIDPNTITEACYLLFDDTKCSYHVGYESDVFNSDEFIKYVYKYNLIQVNIFSDDVIELSDEFKHYNIPNLEIEWNQHSEHKRFTIIDLNNYGVYDKNNKPLFDNQLFKRFISINSCNIKFIADPKDDLQEIAVKNNPYSLKYIKDPCYKVCLEAVTICGNALEFIDEYSFELCLSALKNDGLSVRFLNKYNIDTTELDLLINEAVESDPNALQHVDAKYITFELCKKAVTQNGLSIRFVPIIDKYTDLCMMAIQQNPSAIRFIEHQYINQEMCDFAIKIDPNAIKYICNKYQTKEMCIRALSHDHTNTAYINSNTMSDIVGNVCSNMLQLYSYNDNTYLMTYTIGYPLTSYASVIHGDEFNSKIINVETLKHILNKKFIGKSYQGKLQDFTYTVHIDEVEHCCRLKLQLDRPLPFTAYTEDYVFNLV